MAKSNKNFVKKRSTQLIIIAVALVAIIGVSYAWLTATLRGNSVNSITAGNLSLQLSEGSGDGIQLLSSVPMSDTKASTELTGSGKEYSFTVTNNGNIDAIYSIYLDDQAITGQRLARNKIKYSLKIDNGTPTVALLSSLEGGSDPNSTSVKLDSKTLNPTGGTATTHTYTLKLWIDETATDADLYDVVSNEKVAREYSAKLRLDASQTGIPSGTNVNYETGATVSSGS